MRKKVIRAVLVAMVGVFLVTLVSTGYLYLKKDEIAADLIEMLNKDQKGKIDFQDVSFSPFRNFPNISLKLDNVTVSNDTTESPFISAKSVFGSIDIIDLLRGNISLSHILFDRGMAMLKINEDGVLNIVSTFAKIDTLGVGHSNVAQINIDLQSISINSLDFLLTDERSGFAIAASIDRMGAKLIATNKKTQIEVTTELTTNYMRINQRTFLQNKNFIFSTGFTYDNDHESISLYNGHFQQDEVRFTVDGTYELATHEIDVRTSATDNTLALLSAVIEKDLIDLNKDRVDQGRVHLVGSIKGNTQEGIPDFSFDFGASDVQIILPDGSVGISDLDFSGHFSTGTHHDLSGLSITVDSLRANAGGRDLAGSLHYMNSAAPVIDLELSGMLDLKHLSKMVKIEGVERISGMVQLATTIHSTFDSVRQYFPLNQSTIDVQLQQVALQITDFPDIRDLNVMVSGGDSLIRFSASSFLLDSSRLEFSGTINNFLSYVRNKESISGNLGLKAKHLDLAPLPLADLAIDIDIAYQSKSNQQFTLQVNELKVDPIGYPSISNATGLLVYSNRPSPTLLAKDMDVETSMGNLTTDLQLAFDSTGYALDLNTLDFRSPEGDASFTGGLQKDSSSIAWRGSLTTRKLWLEKLSAKLQGKAFTDSLPSEISADMTFKGVVQLSDTLSGFFTLTNFDGTFTHPELDTLSLYKLQMDIPIFAYIHQDSFNIANVVNASGHASLEQIQSRFISDRDIKFSLEKNPSRLAFQMNSSGLGGEIQSAKLEIEIQEDPEYQLNYEINKVDLGNLAEPGYKNYLRGAVDIQLTASSHGNGIRSVLKNAQGSVQVGGEGIVLYGFNLDEILANYKKSQHFRLTDVGAFMLVGPFGPLITKGYDFARVASIDHADSTTIRKFYSYWDLRNEHLHTHDVAFSTAKSRIAFNGSVDLATLSIPGLTASVLDRKGCSLMDQTVSGTFQDPQFGKLNVVGTLFGPVINVFKLAAGNQCTPVYTGSVEQPPK